MPRRPLTSCPASSHQRQTRRKRPEQMIHELLLNDSSTDSNGSANQRNQAQRHAANIATALRMLTNVTALLVRRLATVRDKMLL